MDNDLSRATSIAFVKEVMSMSGGRLPSDTARTNRLQDIVLINAEMVSSVRTFE